MLFQSAIQTDLLTVPYKGTGPAMNDLLGNQVDFMCDQTTSTTNQIKAGKVKTYGVTTLTRVSSLPNIPTLAESGPPALRGFTYRSWMGAATAAGVPPDIVARLQRSLAASLKARGVTDAITVTSDPDVIRRAERIVLPGVGAFADCRAGLQALSGLDAALREATSAAFAAARQMSVTSVPRGIDAEPSALLPWAAAPGARIIVADGVQSVVAEAGSPDDPALLLIHGFGGSTFGYRDTMGPLAARGWQVRGFDRSPSPVGESIVADLADAEAVAAVLRKAYASPPELVKRTVEMLQ